MNESVVLALIAALSGGVGLAVIQRIIAPAEKRLDDQTAFRKEMREEIVELRGLVKTQQDQIRLHQEQIDSWQAKYFALQIEYTTLEARFESLVAELAALRSGRAGRRATDPIIAPPLDETAVPEGE